MSRLFRLVCVGLALSTPTLLRADPAPDSYWNVDLVKPGMKGQGRTVVQGTKIEAFDAEVIGVVKNWSPGRDLVLCRLSGLNLEKTGVFQGMSGSPIYVQGKLLGAVAYAWPFNKLPLAGVTPFSQMHEYAASSERRDRVKGGANAVGLKSPLILDGRSFDRVTVSDDFQTPTPTAADGIWLTPLRTPLNATGFSRNSLSLLDETFRRNGLTPMQGGGVGAALAADEKEARIEPGSALAVSLVSGDFEMSGIGTVTHVEGKRVYGWGHPFMGLGACEFPLMTGYTHTIIPSLSISFKLGSPLKSVGVINADTSTCVAGWLDRPVDLLPVKATLRRPDTPARTYNVKVIRHKQFMPMLLASVLMNSTEMEGDLGDEVSARLKVRIHVQGQPPIIIDDLHSGPNLGGARGPQMLFGQVAMLSQLLGNNNVGPVRIEKVECETEVFAERRTAEIESVETRSEVYAPGDTVQAQVTLRPYQGVRKRITVGVKLPADLPDGSYTGLVGDELNNVRQEFRDQPHLAFPSNQEHLLKAIALISGARRTHLVLRIPTRDVGVTLGDQALPNLPPSMVQMLGTGRRTGAQPIAGAVVGTVETPFVLQGADSFQFTVSRNKKATTE